MKANKKYFYALNAVVGKNKIIKYIDIIFRAKNVCPVMIKISLIELVILIVNHQKNQHNANLNIY